MKSKKSKKAITAEIKISLWQPKFDELRKEMKRNGASVWLNTRLRSDLRIYGTLLGFAKDDLALENGLETDARDLARIRYQNASTLSSEAWLKYADADGSGNPFTDPELIALEEAEDKALYAWVDIPIVIDAPPASV